MTTIDTAIDAPVDPKELAGSPPQAPSGANAAATLAAPPIAADYYNLTEADGWPVAGLVVLLDRHHRAVRAEVHLYDNTTGRRQDEALHNANQLLINKYWGHTAEDSRLPLRVMRTRQELDSLTIQLDVREAVPLASDETVGWPKWFARANVRLAAAIGIGLALIAGAIAATLAWRSNAPPAAITLEAAEAAPRTVIVPASDLPAPPAAAMANEAPETNAVTADAVAEPVAPSAAETEAVAPSASEAEEAAPAEYVNPFPPNTNDLVPSEVAHDFALLDRAVVTVGHVAMQREPEPDRDLSFAWKPQGTVVQLLGGPVWIEGETATVVWWYVETADDGQKGWMAANGSVTKYLEPLP